MKPVTVIQGAIAVLVVLLIPGLTVGVAAAATFTVNSTDDRVDTQIGNGQCRASNGRCTLRAAIQEANASPTADTILLQRATYQLALAPGTGGPAGGDLDVTAPVAIVGDGTTRTILDGGRPPSGSPPEVRGIDRLLEVHPSAGDVSLSALTVREGYSALPGGGIATASPGVLRLTTVNVTTSYSAKHGGGISNDGRRQGRAHRLDARGQRRQGVRQRPHQRGGGQRADRPEQHRQGQPGQLPGRRRGDPQPRIARRAGHRSR